MLKILFIFVSILIIGMTNEDNKNLLLKDIETIPIAKTVFKLIKNNNEKI